MSDFADVKFDFEASSSNDSSTIPEGDYLTEISTCEKTTSAAWQRLSQVRSQSMRR